VLGELFISLCPLGEEGGFRRGMGTGVRIPQKIGRI